METTHLKRRLWIALASLLIASSANAAVLVEAGDFSNNPFAAEQFVLDVGVNTVSGTLGIDDLDYVEYVVPAGQAVVSQLLTFAALPAIVDPRFSVGSCEFDVVVNCVGSFVSGITGLPFDFAEIREGLVFSSVGGILDCSAQGCFYEVEVLVGDPEVPEPGTIVLLGSAVTAWYGCRRRRKRR